MKLRAMQRSLSFLVVASALAVLLNACGYQLRGWQSDTENAAVAFTTVYLDDQSGDGELNREIRRALLVGGGRIVDAAKDAEARLTLGKREQSHRLVTANASGQAIEYGMRYGFEYIYRIGKNLPLTAEIAASGTYRYDPAQANASERQRRLLERRLRTEAVQNLVRNLRLYREQHPETAPAAPDPSARDDAAETR